MDKNQPSEDRKNATVYVGVVGPEMENGQCGDTIRNLNIRSGDQPPRYIRATKGFEARQTHIDFFLESTYEAIFLMDSDMMFDPDTLDRLRSHGMPYVSGYYMRRTFKPIYPVMFEYNEENEWPYEPMMSDPSPDELYRIGASGWGCVLIHREVFEAVVPFLKGEPFVIEDDMDVWPYDLDVMMRLIKVLNTSRDYKTVRRAARQLAREFRPLTGDKENVGSDIRFPFFAKQAGYDLYLDPSVTPGHIIHYPLNASDFRDASKQEMQKGLIEGKEKVVTERRRRWREQMKRYE